MIVIISRIVGNSSRNCDSPLKRKREQTTRDIERKQGESNEETRI